MLSALRRSASVGGSCWMRSLGGVRAFTSSENNKPYNVPESIWGTNRAARLELACAYRGLNELGLNEGMDNHLSVMAPAQSGEGEVSLVFPYGLHWSEITASSLVGLDLDAKTVEGEGVPDLTAGCIHLGIRRVRPSAKVIMHTHQPYASALAALKDPSILMVHQNSCRFYNHIAYDYEYGGLAHAFEEGERMGKVLGDKTILLMANHGVLCAAPTIAIAYDYLYYLERAAKVQLTAMMTQQPLRLIPEEVCQALIKFLWDHIDHYADPHFYHMYRRLRKIQPDFEL